MSAAADALDTGFDALLASDGEPLTLKRADASTAAVTAIVNRAPGEEHPDRPEFIARDISRIEMRIDAATPIGKAGEHFTDASGLEHRIQSLQRRGHFVVFDCKTSTP